MSASDRPDVSDVFQRRLRLHSISVLLMIAGVVTFIVGSILAVRHVWGEVGHRMTGLGVGFFLAGIAWGLFSTFFNLRCPSCKRFLGGYVSSLATPFTPDAFPTGCPGCNARIIDDDMPRKMRRRMRITIAIVMAVPLIGLLIGAIGSALT